MAAVETATGPIDPSLLGRTLMHEHIFVLSHEINQNCPESWGDEEARVRSAVGELRALKSRGIDTIVDMTVLGLGRFIPRIRRVAAMVDVNIVVATGLYTFDELPIYFQRRRPGAHYDPCEEMRRVFVRDLVEGIPGAGVKAAVLKCATDRRGMTKGVELVLRAVAQAHCATGAPIATHADAATRRGLEQLRILEEEGVDLSRVVIGHCGDTTDLEYLESIVEKGSYLGMDRFGLDPILSFDRRVATVAALCRRGLAGGIVLSHDAACYCDWFEEAALAATLPKWNFLHIPDDVLPALRERGVSDEQIRAMMVDNPRRVLAGGT